jgi:hypothetical protein
MKSVYEKTIFIIIPFTLCITTLLSIVTFISQLLNLHFGIINFTNISVNQFFNSYSGFISFATASIALLTIWLTLKRLQQTQEQLDKMERQVDVSTKQFELTKQSTEITLFYKHREEFIKQLKESKVISFIAVNSGFTLEKLLLGYYSNYYNKSFEKFSPLIKPDILQKIKNFTNEIKKSELSNNNIDLMSFDLDIVTKLLSGFIFHFYEIPLTLKSTLEKSPEANIHFNLLSEDQQNIFYNLASIYFSYKIITEILFFSAEFKSEFMIGSFIGNFEKLCEKHGFEFLLVPYP